MSNHFDYMPKPAGWVSSEPESEEKAIVTEITETIVEEAEPEKSVDKEVPAESDRPEKPVDETPLESAVTRCASVLSWICVPLMMPVYGIILIFTLSFLAFAPFMTKLVFTLIVFGANFVVPMLLILLLKKIGVIEDVGLNGRKERLIPYLITMVCLGGTSIFLYMKMAPLWVAMFYAGGALAGLINMIVNLRWKISAHAAGIAGIVAMLIQIMKEGPAAPSTTGWIIGSIILAGLLGSARIWLGRHTLMQVLCGTAVGFLSVWTLSLI